MNTPATFAFVLFGATGDLSLRKILPALYHADRTGKLNEAGRIVAVARMDLDTPGYRTWAEQHVRPHLDERGFTDETWRQFLQRIEYVRLDLSDHEKFGVLRECLNREPGTNVFYLATGPSLFIPICKALASQGLHEGNRVVLEKPLGSDLKSSMTINDAVGEIFDETQIYRIDHYLGKESVQNLLALRFGNALFEPLWRREWIDSIQITIAEELGVEGRGDFYDQTGALRDMVQNHLLQLLAIVAMEPPHSMAADPVRDEKLRVLRSLRTITPEQVGQWVVRGQYQAGIIKGVPAAGYAQEPGVAQGSQTETFVALKAEINNWRWAGVPFFLRTGKRLGERVAEIVINFKPVPYALLGDSSLRAGANRLVIRLQPNESIRLYCLAKQPGEGMRLQSVHLDLAFDQFFKADRMEAYERLLLDVIHGRLALFVRRDEQEQAWRWVEPILAGWASSPKPPKLYSAGTWGPPAASALLAPYGTCWLEEEN